MIYETKVTAITITTCVNRLLRNMEFKGIEEIEIKNWLFGPYNGETNLEFIYIEIVQLLVDVCDIENMTNL
jgi:hypothetical protein